MLPECNWRGHNILDSVLLRTQYKTVRIVRFVQYKFMYIKRSIVWGRIQRVDSVNLLIQLNSREVVADTNECNNNIKKHDNKITNNNNYEITKYYTN